MEHQQYFDLLAAADLAGVQAYLRAYPAAANAVDADGVPAILRGLACAEEDLGRWLIEQSLTRMHIRDTHGAGPLHYAAANGSAGLLRYMVERCGFDPLDGDSDGVTPYEIAHNNGNKEGEACFAALVGADWEQLYKNPVLPGFKPDPSVIRVGEDYYMVNSSFTWFPAVPISHSRDLIHWELIGHVLTEENAAMLQGLESGHGYWAPDISYANGRFYVTVTLRRNDSHERPRAQIVTGADRPEGPYDPPAIIEENGIDPSLFTDDDGKNYMVVNRGARLVPLSADFRTSTGPARLLWYGDNKRASEGPHLLKKDGWYYLFLAEGGTGLGHQISVGRSRTLDGVYEPCPYNPILHQYNTQGYLQKSGHGKPVQTQNGDWYMVYLCARPRDGFSPLGRETGLDPLQWTADGWPIVNRRRGPSPLQRKPALPEFTPRPQSLDPQAGNTMWVAQRGAAKAEWKDDTLFLQGDTDLDDIDSRAGVFTRQTALCCRFTARLCDLPEAGAQAGVTAYYDERSYCKFGFADGRLSLTVRERDRQTTVAAALADPAARWLRIEAEDLTRRFYHSADGQSWTLFANLPRTEFLCDEGKGCGKRFTGAMLGLYAVGGAARFAGIALENKTTTKGRSSHNG